MKHNSNVTPITNIGELHAVGFTTIISFPFDFFSQMFILKYPSLSNNVQFGSYTFVLNWTQSSQFRQKKVSCPLITCLTTQSLSSQTFLQLTHLYVDLCASFLSFSFAIVTWRKSHLRFLLQRFWLLCQNLHCFGCL